MCFARQPAVVALAGKTHADFVRLQAVAGGSERGIIIAAALAEPVAFVVDAHQGQQQRIEAVGADFFTVKLRYFQTAMRTFGLRGIGAVRRKP